MFQLVNQLQFQSIFATAQLLANHFEERKNSLFSDEILEKEKGNSLLISSIVLGSMSEGACCLLNRDQPSAQRARWKERTKTFKIAIATRNGCIMQALTVLNQGILYLIES